MQRGATSAFTSARTPTWFPPASVAEGDKELFGVDKDEFPPNFWIPPRLKDKSAELIEVSANLSRSHLTSAPSSFSVPH